MTKSRVKSNPEIPPNPTSNHQPALLRSYRHYYCIIIIILTISFYLLVFPSNLWKILNVPKNKSSKESEIGRTFKGTHAVAVRFLC